MRRLRRLLLNREERAALAAFDRGTPVEVTGRPTVVLMGQNTYTSNSGHASLRWLA